MIIGLRVSQVQERIRFSLFFKNLLIRERQEGSVSGPLKKEATTWTLPNYGIDAQLLSPRKEIIRDFLVFHASRKRQETQGRHWIGLVSEELQKYKNSNDIAIITDIRYCDYEKDEIYWLKEELGGV